MKPALGTGGGVGSHLSSPIQRDARSWMTKTMEIDTLPGSGFPNLKKKLEDSQKFAYIQTITNWSSQQQGCNNRMCRV